MKLYNSVWLILAICISLENYPLHLHFQIYLHRGLQSNLFKYLMFQCFFPFLFLILNIYAFSYFLLINLASGWFDLYYECYKMVWKLILCIYHISIKDEKMFVVALWLYLYFLILQIQEHLLGNLWMWFTLYIVQRRKKSWIKEMSAFITEIIIHSWLQNKTFIKISLEYYKT